MSQETGSISLKLIKITSITWFIFLGILIYFFLKDTGSLEIHEPIEILNENKTVKPEENLVMRLIWNKENHYPAFGYKFVYCKSGNHIPYDKAEPDITWVGKHQEAVSDYTVIPEHKDDTCKLYLTVNIYSNNALRTPESKIFETEWFHIKN